jgi:gliding motility-associated-like protein
MKTGLFSKWLIFIIASWVHFMPAQCISTYPALETFESGPVWTVNGVNSDWMWGTPAHPTINTAGGGIKSWCVGGLSGTFYNFSEQAWIQSPCYNFSALNYPWVSFKIFWECEHQWDGVVLQSSINGGTTWQNVGAFGDPVDCNTANWFNYGNITWLNSLPSAQRQGWTGRIGPTAGTCAGGFGSGGWVVAKHCLTGLANQPNVIFRFLMGSGTTCNSYDGLAFDDFYVSEGMAHAPDFSVTCTGAGNFNFTAITPSCPVTSSYTWNFGDPGSGALNTSNLANPNHVFSTSGIFTITLTTAGGGCNPPGSITHTLSVSSVSNAVVSQSINCFGGTGNASVSVISGPGPFGYTWSPSGGNSATSTAVPAGTYSVSISDGNGCVYIKTVTITQPPILTAAMSSSNVSCNGGNNGSATVTASGGTPGYTYNWTPSGGTSSVASGFGVGSYTCTITDNHGCTVTAVAVISQPAALTAVVSSSNATCGMLNGSATVTAGGGTPGYTYSWTPSGGTSSVATGLGAGNYTCLITDNKGCTVTAIVPIIQPVSMSVTVSSVNVSCNGGNNGAATVIVSGGTNPYSFTWSPAPGMGQGTGTVSGLIAQVYTVQISDAQQCSTVISVPISQPPALTVIMSSSNVSCNGGNNGSATVTASGGTPGYTYNWTPSGGTSSVAANLSAGSYTATITDNHGCTVTAVAVISQPPVLTAIMSSSNISCNGANNGSATVTAGGGTPGYTYNWLPSGGTSSVATGLGVGSYTSVVTDNHGCTVTAVAVISQPSALTAITTGSNATCGVQNGSATITVGGGTPGYTYNWVPSGGTSSVATGLGAGNYTCMVTDNHGCTMASTIVINQPISMTVAITSTNVTCNGGNNGAAIVVVSGGTNPYSYTWSPSPGMGQGTGTVSLLSAQNYTVQIADAQLCSTVVAIPISQPAALTAALSSSNVSCNGGNNGSATVTVGGGTPGYTYSWTPSGSTFSVVTNLNAGSYTTIVTDNSGCTVSAVANIVQPTAMILSVAPINISCFGANNGSASVTVNGGTPSYSYTWTPTGGNSSGAVNLAAGNYTVLVKDINNCTATVSAAIIQPTAPLAANISGSNIQCFGSNNGSATVTASGGSIPYSYSWTPTGGGAAQASGLGAGCYTVMVKDVNNCAKTASVIISQPPQLQANVSPVKLCAGQSGILSASVSGGVAPYTYLWNNNAGPSAITVSAVTNVVYTLSVADANGCSAPIDTALVTTGGPLSLSVSPASTICAGKSSSLTAQGSGGIGNYQYSWLPGNMQGPTINVTLSNTTVYTVTVSDGCTHPLAVQVTTIFVEGIGNSTLTSDKYEGCAPLCVKLDDPSLNGVSLQNIVWNISGGAMENWPQPVHCFTAAGVYTVSNVYSTKLGCVGSGTLNKVITVYSTPEADFSASQYTVSDLSPNVQFTNTSTGATSYMWNFGGLYQSYDANPSHNFSDAGIYLVAMVAYNGSCSDTIYKVIECLPDFTFYAPNTFTPNDDNLNDRFLPKGEGWKPETYKLRVFDRWGEELFYTQRYDEGWDGIYKGQLVKEDEYVWTVTLEDIFNKRHEYKGTILVLK